MPEDAIAIVAALILEWPLCMACITAMSGLAPEQAGLALGAIELVVKVHRDATGRCQGCGVSGLVVYSERPVS